jgi:hypothetical protein
LAPPFKSHLKIIDVRINILNLLTHDVNTKLHAIVKLHPPATEAMLNLAQRPSQGAIGFLRRLDEALPSAGFPVRAQRQTVWAGGQGRAGEADLL